MTRMHLITSGTLDALPELDDRLLVCDAIVYGCDAFITRDWRTVLSRRASLSHLPIRILAPSEWWEIVRPWAGLWV